MLRLLARTINKTWYFIELARYYVVLVAVRTYLSIKWSPWSPWTVARLNLAWSNYVQTSMYKERLEAPEALHTNKNFENYAEQAYIQNVEAALFIELFTRKEKLKILFLPFSCGDKNKIPFYRISNWILGIKK